ncbi:hypothetical protein GDO86_016660, partial [Hymenochirus boettgeri]
AGSDYRPFVTFNPNWATIFTKESLTLTCNTDPTDSQHQTYYWYKDNQWIKKYEKSIIIDRAYEIDSGDYQCRVGNSHRSEAVRLIVSDGYLALKVPPDVYEGDDLYVSCAAYPKYKAKNPTLYKNNELLTSKISGDIIKLGTARMSMSGSYTCTRDSYYSYTTYNSKADISVKELFTKPELNVNGNQLLEGDHMTITCDTKLSPRRATTELQFGFYRNGINVQGFNSSNQYRVPSAQLEDSGSYICEVQTVTGSVRKRSDTISINVKVKLPSSVTVRLDPPGGEMIAGEKLEVVCSVDNATGLFQFSWCNQSKHCDKKTTKTQKERFVVKNVVEDYGGEYQCTAKKVGSQLSITSTKIKISVREPVSNASISPGDDIVEVAVEDTQCMTCSVMKGSSPTFIWLYNDEKIDNGSERYQIRDSGKMLCIESAQHHHSGTYQCQATNQMSSNRTFHTHSGIINLRVSVRSYTMVGIGASLALVMILLVAAFVVFKYRHTITSGLSNCHLSAKSSGNDT